MCAESSYKKSGSPQSSTELSSLQVNRSKNIEVLERRLKCRRSVKELVNQGILISPSISNPDKVRQLQLAKTSDILRQKIEKRPDRQSLVSRRIIRDDKPGTSPYILEQCHNLAKYQLKSSLNSKLTTRPGSLELVEKGVLQVDPGVDSLIRCGSIPYPRVESVSHNELTLSSDGKIPTPPPLSVVNTPLYRPIAPQTSRPPTGRLRLSSSSSSVAASVSSSRTFTNRSMRDETVVYKLGSLVFHNYCPKSTHSAGSPNVASSTFFLQKQKAREVQQAEMLRLQDTARVHRLVERELSDKVFTFRYPLTSDQTTTKSGDKCFQIIPLSSASPASSLNSPSSFGSYVNQINCASPEQSLPSLSPINTPMIRTPNDPNTVLEQLNISQLRSECRERRLPRSGTKAALVRQLEPFRDKLVAKYFPKCSTTANPTTTQTGTIVNQANSITLLSAPPPPIWNFPVGPVLSSSSSSTSTNHQSTSDGGGGYFLHTEAVSISTNPTISFNSQSVFHDSSSAIHVLHQSSPLRHSNSAPYMIDHTGADHCEHLSAVHLNSVVSTSVIPVQLATMSQTPLSNEQPQQQQSLVSSMPIQPVNYNPSDPSIIAASLTTGLFPLPYTAAAASILPAPSITNSSVNTGLNNPVIQGPHSGNALLDHAQANFDNPTFPQCVFMLETQSTAPSVVPTSQTLHTTPTTLFRSVPDPILTSSPAPKDHAVQLSTLNQIEDIWLQIRQLNRRIAKEKLTATSTKAEQPGGDVTSLDCSMLDQLVEERNRLVVLCRLLVVDRIDVLDELLDSGVGSIGSDATSINATHPTDSKLDVERDLMKSYLNRLGGIEFANRVTASSPFTTKPLCDHHRRSSSPFDHGYNTTNTAAHVHANMPNLIDEPNHLNDVLMSHTSPDIHPVASSSGGSQNVVEWKELMSEKDSGLDSGEPVMTEDAYHELLNIVLKDWSTCDREHVLATANHTMVPNTTGEVNASPFIAPTNTKSISTRPQTVQSFLSDDHRDTLNSQHNADRRKVIKLDAPLSISTCKSQNICFLPSTTTNSVPTDASSAHPVSYWISPINNTTLQSRQLETPLYVPQTHNLISPMNFPDGFHQKPFPELMDTSDSPGPVLFTGIIPVEWPADV